jgi:glycosyltransferase involved in cell wall biosynthesis
VVLPSFYREGVPRILLEAAACGRPVITTDFPGCRDAVIDGQTGFLCTPKDETSLHGTMLRVIDMTSSEREAMGRAARQLAEQKFCDDLVLQAYSDCLAGLVSRNV